MSNNQADVEMTEGSRNDELQTGATDDNEMR